MDECSYSDVGVGDPFGPWTTASITNHQNRFNNFNKV